MQEVPCWVWGAGYNQMGQGVQDVPSWVWGCRRCPVWGLQVHTGDAQLDRGVQDVPSLGCGCRRSPSPLEHPACSCSPCTRVIPLLGTRGDRSWPGEQQGCGSTQGLAMK